jgi:hypothetical protein
VAWRDVAWQAVRVGAFKAHLKTVQPEESHAGAQLTLN